MGNYNYENTDTGHHLHKSTANKKAKSSLAKRQRLFATLTLIIVAQAVAALVIVVLNVETISQVLMGYSALMTLLLLPGLYILFFREDTKGTPYFKKAGTLNDSQSHGDKSSNKTLDSSDKQFKSADAFMFDTLMEWEYIFDAMPEAITVHDRDYNIIKANSTAKKILQLPSLNGDPVKCYKYYHGGGNPHKACPSCKCIEIRELVSFEVFEPHFNRYIEISTVPRYDRAGRFTGILHVTKDISHRKDTEVLIQRQIKRLAISNFIDRAIAANLNLNSILHILTDLIMRHLEIDAADVLLLNKETKMLRHAAGKGFRAKELIHTELRLRDSLAGLAAIERRTVTVPDLLKKVASFESFRDSSVDKFISYVAVPLIAKDEVQGVMELYHRTRLDPESEWIEFLENIASQAAIAIDNAAMVSNLERSKNELVNAYDSTIAGWSHALDMRDKETEGHSRRVAEMTVRIAEEIGIQGEELIHIRRGAFLHDIGKMAIPDSILLKPARLTPEERKAMEHHTVYAMNMIKDIEYLHPSLDIPLNHHEKWNGKGYPRQLKETEIPVAARIFAIVDVWDALSSDRPYRSAWPREKVLNYIRDEAGEHFDPRMVDVFMKVLNRDYIDTRKETG